MKVNCQMLICLVLSLHPTNIQEQTPAPGKDKFSHKKNKVFIRYAKQNDHIFHTEKSATPDPNNVREKKRLDFSRDQPSELFYMPYSHPLNKEPGRYNPEEIPA